MGGRRRGITTIPTTTTATTLDSNVGFNRVEALCPSRTPWPARGIGMAGESPLTTTAGSRKPTDPVVPFGPPSLSFFFVNFMNSDRHVEGINWTERQVCPPQVALTHATKVRYAIAAGSVHTSTQYTEYAWQYIPRIHAVPFLPEGDDAKRRDFQAFACT